MRSPAVTYAASLAVLAVAVLLRWLLDPWMGDTLPLVTLFGAVAGAVWLGGWRPALLACLLGYAACDYLFIAPRSQLDFDASRLVGLAAYLFTCSLIIGFGEATRAARQRAGARQELLQVTLRSIGDAVITTDIQGRVTYLNAVAESLTGWRQADALGRPLEQVFRILNQDTRQPVENPAARALREGLVIGLANHTVLVGKDGSERPIDDSAAPIRDERGRVSGCVLIFRDVSLQRRVDQDKTRQLLTARLLAAIVESSDDAIISKSLDGTIQTWNAAAERVFGHRAEHAIGKHISLVIPPDRMPEEDAIIASMKAGRRIEHFETERVRGDGRRIRVSLTISPIKDETGLVVGASKIARDVTEQRRAEERERWLLSEAAAANAKFSAFFEQGALFAGIMGVDGVLLEANRLSWEGCGYAKEQVIGKAFWDGPWWTPAPAVADRIRAACAYAASGHMFRAELPFYLADGSERTVDLTVLPIRDPAGRALFLAATGNDVTERRRAETERERFATLVENSTDFIGICNLDGIPLYVNRAGMALVGLDSFEQTLRTPVSEFFFPEDRARIANELFPEVLANGHGETEVRFRNFKTGAARWMAYKVLTLNDAAGRPIALATVSQDITERKQLEDDLRALASDLSETDRRKDEFLAMLAHELRNPLAPISNAVQVLRVAGDDGVAVHTASALLERQVSHMARLVDDLLDMSRITRGKIELRKEPVELAPILTQAVEAVRPLCESMGHELTVTLPPQPVHLDADPTRLAQVVGNLLNNACKFTDRSGHIWLTGRQEGRDAVVRVRDSGIGIAAPDLPRLFEMFTQVDTSRERSRGGLGIGLTLVRSLVALHGGSVEVCSDGLGRGSEFTVRLPVLEQAQRPAPGAAAGKGASSARRRVLIVDDNQDGAESLAILLRIAGHETRLAHDGLQAIAAAEAFRPDLVLLDIGLPKMNGYEVCRRIRQQPWGRHMVLVAVTGWGQEEDQRKSREAGFDRHLVKPVDQEELARLLAALPRDGAADR